LLALDTRLQRRVVLKQPLGPWLADPTYRKQFLQEARLAARIQHPNVVTVYEVLTEEEPPLLVLEYVDGSNLETELRARGRLPPQEAVRVALEVLAGLERIHAEGIVHRDLKPANILLAADGTAKVTDFGVAQAPREAALAATVMSGGGQPGTLAYMSPEQVRGEDVDARTDLYALAAVLVECLTGAHYAAGWEDEFELRKRILTTPPALDHEGIPAGLAPVLAQALAKRPDERPADARAMARAMRKAVPELARRAAARTTAP
ncbi:MAG TPA: serine/threonine-protein kinase, partial [Candidatus Thermoplasmatota archaeon]|nr:serine/threonine-protein kinase [Candidatus Thermoplasmatota archaeon]